MRSNIMAIVAILFLASCGNESKTKQNLTSHVTNYEIRREEKRETSNKAQLIEYVVYKDTIYTSEILEKVLLDVYNKNKDKDVFDNFEAATVFGVYVFTSTELAENDKSAWICMLTKGPNDSEPSLSYNDLKMKSLQGLNDSKKTEDEIAYENLNVYLKERKLELCSFYKQLDDMELECIHKADAKYPDYGVEHSDYSEKLMREERKKLSKKYNMADSVFLRVSVYALAYCK